MSKKRINCPECGLEMQKRSLDRHLEFSCKGGSQISEEVVSDRGQDLIGGESQLAGEIGRLRGKIRTDPSKNWEDVYHSYVKVSGSYDTVSERRALKARLHQQRALERW